MATNNIPIKVSDNQERITLGVRSVGVNRSVTPDNGSPYYVGARAYVEQTAGGAVMTVIDKEGTTTATILNGTNGIDGVDGVDGIDGVDGVGITSIVQNEDGTLTINLDDGSSYDTEPLKGEDGQDGYTPIKGVDYFDGEDGQDGADGYTPIKGVDYFDGEDGQDGTDGYSPTATVTKSGDTATISITDINGTTTATVSDGTDGTDGTDGQDGVGIASITKTGTVGLVDTYTITYTDGTFTTYEVTNGANGTGSVADVWVDGSSVLDGDTAKIDLTGKADVGDIPTKTSDLTNDSGFITGYTETDPVFTASAAHGISSTDITNWNGKSDFSGDYDDLTNKPTIPTNLSDLGNDMNVSDFPNDAGYLTSFTETDPTVPSWAKQASKPSYTASEVGAQETLVSGTNIKTINNTSLLGSGDITVASSGTSVPTADEVAEFDNDAHMNSTDMTSQEVDDFVDSLNLYGGATIQMGTVTLTDVGTSEKTVNVAFGTPFSSPPIVVASMNTASYNRRIHTNSITANGFSVVGALLSGSGTASIWVDWIAIG